MLINLLSSIYNTNPKSISHIVFVLDFAVSLEEEMCQKVPEAQKTRLPSLSDKRGNLVCPESRGKSVFPGKIRGNPLES